jgi:Zn-dependent peptidase ImmA (M78 family)
MIKLTDPIAMARQVLENKGINDIPALALQDIANDEGIRFKFADYPDNLWDGTLLFKGEKRAILVNTHRGLIGRHNFTFAHELGHYFLAHQPTTTLDGRPIIRCTTADIRNNANSNEVEANRFAAELLMPEERFRLDMAGAPIDFGLISSLSNKYMVSKHACGIRIANFTQNPCVIIRTNGTSIMSATASHSASNFLRNLTTIPKGTTAQKVITTGYWQKEFAECESSIWLQRTIPNGTVYECTYVPKDSKFATIILKW